MKRNGTEVHASLHNRFDIEVADKDTGEVRETAVAYNIITEQLWARLFSSSTTLTSYANYIHYGTGSGTPSREDTSLFAFTRAIACESPTYSYDYVNGVVSARRRIQIPETLDDGVRISEVGVAYGTAASTLCTHAMIVDSHGQPSAIVKTDRDVVNIYSTLYLDFSSKDESSDGLFFAHYLYRSGTSVYLRYSPLLDFLGALPSSFSGISVAHNPTYAPAGETTYHKLTGTVDYRNVGTEWEQKFIRRYTLNADRYAVEEGNISGGIAVIVLTNSVSSMTGTTYNPQGLFVAGHGWNTGSDIQNESVGTGDGVTKDFRLKYRYAESVHVMVNGLETDDVFTSQVPNDAKPTYYLEYYHGDSTLDNMFPLFISQLYSDYMYVNDYNLRGSNHFYVKNPFYEAGLNTIRFGGYWAISWSNDLSEWHDIGSNTSSSSKTFTLTGEAEHAKYYKFESIGSSTSTVFYFTSNGDLINAIHFNTPPAEGDVITASYHTPAIAKDENHVLDFSLVFDFSDPD